MSRTCCRHRGQHCLGDQHRAGAGAGGGVQLVDKTSATIRVGLLETGYRLALRAGGPDHDYVGLPPHAYISENPVPSAALETATPTLTRSRRRSGQRHRALYSIGMEGRPQRHGAGRDYRQRKRLNTACRMSCPASRWMAVRWSRGGASSRAPIAISATTTSRRNGEKPKPDPDVRAVPQSAGKRFGIPSGFGQPARERGLRADDPPHPFRASQTRNFTIWGYGNSQNNFNNVL